MFDHIKNLFKKKYKVEEGKINKDAAKERLHLVLMQDRANVSADFLELMRQEIISVIKKYVDVDEKEIDVKLTSKQNSDGTVSTPALYANIPIKGLKVNRRSRKSTTTKSTTASSNTAKKDNNNGKNETKKVDSKKGKTSKTPTKATTIKTPEDKKKALAKTVANNKAQATKKVEIAKKNLTNVNKQLANKKENNNSSTNKNKPAAKANNTKKANTKN